MLDTDGLLLSYVNPYDFLKDILRFIKICFLHQTVESGDKVRCRVQNYFIGIKGYNKNFHLLIGRLWVQILGKLLLLGP